MTELSSRAAELHSVVITGVGVASSVGACTAQTLASLRAGISRMVEYSGYEPIIRDPAAYLPEDLIAAPAAGMDADFGLAERLLALGVPALQETLTQASVDDSGGLRVHLRLVGGQSPAVAAGSRVATTLAQRLSQRISDATFEQVSYAATGAAGFLTSLGEAAGLLTAGACDVVIVGAIDSLLGGDTLRWLDDQLRIKTQEHPTGLVPGEGASFVALELAEMAGRRSVEPLARLGGVSSSFELASISSESPCTGDALASCVRDVLSQMESGGAAPSATFCNLNGEMYYANEWGYAQNRVVSAGGRVPEETIHPADCVGETGAAMGGMLTCLAADAVRAKGPSLFFPLIWCSTDGGERSAAYLRPFEGAD